MPNPRKILRAILPSPLLRLRREFILAQSQRKTAAMTTEQVFTDIYLHNRWGGQAGAFSSGTGSWDDSIVAPYVAAVRQWLTEQGAESFTVVDLGCGDFNVGRQLADLCQHFIGVDIVEPVVQYNSRTFGSDRIEFRHLDMVNASLPDGQVCFLRQVLQHLSNDQILKILPKLGKYRWTLITEHQPSPGRVREPNMDKPHGGDIRLYRESGIFLDQPPFSVPRERLRLLLEVKSRDYNENMDPGVIRTYVLDGG
jgi:SAM-dependent methyltransferase